MAYLPVSAHKNAHLTAAILLQRNPGRNRACRSLMSAGCHTTCIFVTLRELPCGALHWEAVHQFLGSSLAFCPGSFLPSRLALSMTTVVNAPLVSRTPSLPLLDSPVRLRPTTKRARSPVPADQCQAQEHSIKRHKLSASTNGYTAIASEKDRRKAEKLEKEAVWRAKYLEHFPRWIFFFDPDGLDKDAAAMRKRLIRGVQSLGAVGAKKCFSQRRSTHLFTVGG